MFICHFQLGRHQWREAFFSCFAQRNSYAVSLLSSRGVVVTDNLTDTIVPRCGADTITGRVNLDVSRHHLSLYLALYLSNLLKEIFRMSQHWFLHHFEPLRQCGLNYPQLITKAALCIALVPSSLGL